MIEFLPEKRVKHGQEICKLIFELLKSGFNSDTLHLIHYIKNIAGLIYCDVVVFRE